MIETIEEFGQALALELTQAIKIPVVAYDDGHSVEFQSGDLNGRLNTDNFYINYRHGMPLSHIVDIFLQSAKEANPKYDEVKDLLRLAPTSQTYALGKPIGNIQDLRLGIVVEHDAYRSYLVENMLKSLHKTEEELWDVAWNNMTNTMPQHTVHNPPGAELLAFQESLGSGYAYVHAASLQGDAYLSMPYMDLGFVGVDVDPQANEQVLSSQAVLTLNCYKDAPDHPISPAVFHFRDGKIVSMMGAIPIA